ncbi:hypothetical protein [Brochothrix thermosphacta]|uniref:hypothetical protein n=1 Tax=Brochothrix thermosphacta TaxID=2756 RepID=UPI00083F8118|nr:hypothetical protein [Brochothrix thermosphacta]ODJ71158.1 hypothetical protein BFR43_04680 [Brochothrix thermosphacta]
MKKISHFILGCILISMFFPLIANADTSTTVIKKATITFTESGGGNTGESGGGNTGESGGGNTGESGGGSTGESDGGSTGESDDGNKLPITGELSSRYSFVLGILLLLYSVYAFRNADRNKTS